MGKWKLGKKPHLGIEQALWNQFAENLEESSEIIGSTIGRSVAEALSDQLMKTPITITISVKPEGLGR